MHVGVVTEMISSDELVEVELADGRLQQWPLSELLHLPRFMYRSASATELSLVEKNIDVNSSNIRERDRGIMPEKDKVTGVRTLKGIEFTLRKWIAHGHYSNTFLRGNSGFMTFTDNPAVAVQYARDYSNWMSKHLDVKKNSSQLEEINYSDEFIPKVLRLDVQAFLLQGGSFQKLLPENVENITNEVRKALPASDRRTVKENLIERLRGSMFAESHGEWQVDLLDHAVPCSTLYAVELAAYGKQEEFPIGWMKPRQDRYFNLLRQLQTNHQSEDDVQNVGESKRSSKRGRLVVPTYKTQEQPNASEPVLFQIPPHTVVPPQTPPHTSSSQQQLAATMEPSRMRFLDIEVDALEISFVFQPRKSKPHTYSMLRSPEEEAAAHLLLCTVVHYIDLTDCDAEQDPEPPRRS